MVGDFSDVCDTIAPVNMPYQGSHYYSLHDSKLALIDDCFSCLIAWIALSRVINII